MQGDSVVFGFEVYHQHRIGGAGAAELGVAWLELDPHGTARAPYGGTFPWRLPTCAEHIGRRFLASSGG